MVTSLPPGSMDFLQTDPAPVTGQPAPPKVNTEDRLPQAVVDRLMKISGVDGVWIEHDAQGKRVVVLHYTPKGPAKKLPSSVEGLPTRIVGGEPIRAF